METARKKRKREPALSSLDARPSMDRAHEEQMTDAIAIQTLLEISVSGERKLSPAEARGELQNALQSRYAQALQHGTTKLNRVRVALVGEEGGGKTSTLRNLLGMEFETQHIETSISVEDCDWEMPSIPDRSSMELTVSPWRESQSIWTLEEGIPLTVGRGASSSVRLQDMRVSSKHCSISLRGEDVFVRDLHAKNGTSVNGQVISRGEEVRVVVGDIICVPADGVELIAMSVNPTAISMKNGEESQDRNDVCLLAPEIEAWCLKEGLPPIPIDSRWAGPNLEVLTGIPSDVAAALARGNAPPRVYGQKCVLSIWEFGGISRLRALFPTFFRSACPCVVVVDLSFPGKNMDAKVENTRRWLDTVFCTFGSLTKLIFVGTHSAGCNGRPSDILALLCKRLQQWHGFTDAETEIIGSAPKCTVENSCADDPGSLHLKKELTKLAADCLEHSQSIPLKWIALRDCLHAGFDPEMPVVEACDVISIARRLPFDVPRLVQNWKKAEWMAAAYQSLLPALEFLGRIGEVMHTAVDARGVQYICHRPRTLCKLIGKLLDSTTKLDKVVSSTTREGIKPSALCPGVFKGGDLHLSWDNVVWRASIVRLAFSHFHIAVDIPNFGIVVPSFFTAGRDFTELKRQVFLRSVTSSTPSLTFHCKFTPRCPPTLYFLFITSFFTRLRSHDANFHHRLGHASSQLLLSDGSRVMLTSDASMLQFVVWGACPQRTCFALVAQLWHLINTYYSDTVDPEPKFTVSRACWRCSGCALLPLGTQEDSFQLKLCNVDPISVLSGSGEIPERLTPRSCHCGSFVTVACDFTFRTLTETVRKAPLPCDFSGIRRELLEAEHRLELVQAEPVQTFIDLNSATWFEQWQKQSAALGEMNLNDALAQLYGHMWKASPAASQLASCQCQPEGSDLLILVNWANRLHGQVYSLLCRHLVHPRTLKIKLARKGADFLISCRGKAFLRTSDGVVQETDSTVAANRCSEMISASPATQHRNSSSVSLGWDTAPTGEANALWTSLTCKVAAVFFVPEYLSSARCLRELGISSARLDNPELLALTVRDTLSSASHLALQSIDSELLSWGVNTLPLQWTIVRCMNNFQLDELLLAAARCDSPGVKFSPFSRRCLGPKICELLNTESTGGPFVLRHNQTSNAYIGSVSEASRPEPAQKNQSSSSRPQSTAVERSGVQPESEPQPLVCVFSHVELDQPCGVGQKRKWSKVPKCFRSVIEDATGVAGELQFCQNRIFQRLDHLRKDLLQLEKNGRGGGMGTVLSKPLYSEKAVALHIFALGSFQQSKPDAKQCRPCPVKGCPYTVAAPQSFLNNQSKDFYHMKSHLIRVHEWTPAEATYNLVYFRTFPYGYQLRLGAESIERRVAKAKEMQVLVDVRIKAQKQFEREMKEDPVLHEYWPDKPHIRLILQKLVPICEENFDLWRKMVPALIHEFEMGALDLRGRALRLRAIQADKKQKRLAMASASSELESSTAGKRPIFQIRDPANSPLLRPEYHASGQDSGRQLEPGQLE